MASHLDAIIIGAGLGGLTASAKLLGAGRRVLVLEKNPHPGGTAYVYHRRGFSFPMGPLGFSHADHVRSILKGLGDEGDFPLRRVHYRLRALGCDLPLSLPPAGMVNVLARRFPSDAGAVERFFQEVSASLSPRGPGTDVSAPFDLYRGSASEYLAPRIRDSRLRRILGSLGTREPYSSLPLLAAMWQLMIEEGIWHPASGMKAFSDRLVRLPERFPGGPERFRLGTEVASIRVENGKVMGVTLRDGFRIDAPSVISNADYKTTFLKLLDRRAIPPVWHRAVSRARQTSSLLQVCLGVDISKADLSAFQDASRLIYRHPEDDRSKAELDWHSAEIDPQALAREECEISLWSQEEASLAPQGKAVVVIRTEAPYSHFARHRLGWRKRDSGYEAYKTRLGRSLVQEAENLIPRLGEAIEVMDVATPLTFEDQGGRSEGAIAGWSWDDEDSSDDKPRELIRTPIKGLYMAGYQAFSALFMGGIPTAMESGIRAARAVLEGADPIEEALIPGVKPRKRTRAERKIS